MSKVQMLRALVKQRLTAAAEDIFGLFERTIAEYEETLCRSKEENERQRRLLDAVFNPQLRLHRAECPVDVPQLLVNKEEVLPEQQQECSPSLDQEDPEPPHIKEEQEEVWTNQKGEQLQGLEEVKEEEDEEEDEEKPQSSQLHEQVETEVDGEDFGGPEPDRNSHPDTHLTPDTEDKSEDSSETEISDGDWKETREPQSGLKSLKSNDVSVTDVGCKTDKRPFSCSECGKRWDCQADLTVHMRVHTGERPFGCSVCGKGFSQRSNLRRHMTRHTGEKPFSCPVCKKLFRYGGNIRRHMKIHMREKSFSCSLSEPDKSDGWKETREPQSGSNSQNNNEVSVSDTTADKSLSCSDCGKTFSRRYCLNIHRRLHTGEKPYSCSVCGKKFNQRNTFNEHMKRHTGQDTFNCSLCGKKFGYKFRLRDHMRTHTGERPLSCPVCDKGFRYNAELIAHMRRHSGEKPFSCSVCHKGFRLKSILKNHMKVHTGEKPFSCSVGKDSHNKEVWENT